MYECACVCLITGNYLLISGTNRKTLNTKTLIKITDVILYSNGV